LTQLSHVSWQRQEYSTITEEQKSETGAPPEFTENEKKLKADIELLNKELIDLKSHKNDLEDKYKRALADGENLRVRLIKQIEDAKIFGIQGFCKDLLEVADILGKATESVPKDELTEKNPHLKTLYEGLKMTEAQLHKEVEGKEPGTVVVVSKLGYKLHERVVRPALVGVAKG
ncbi:unnamed protein product, partial [Heterotrigona itama]